MSKKLLSCSSLPMKIIIYIILKNAADYYLYLILVSGFLLHLNLIINIIAFLHIFSYFFPQ